MITVRFPSGFSVQYNSLWAQRWDNDGRGCTLYQTAADRDAGKSWLVHVPADCIVEFTPPCRTYQAAPVLNPDTARLAELEKQIRGLRRQIKELAKR